MLKVIKNNKILILIILIGFFLRVYKPLLLFQYSHDHDLAGWFIRDILSNHHFRLIGQETSSHGIFIGPYFYYLQIPFYLIGKMNPAAALALPILLSVFSIFSVYKTFKEMFTKKIGLIGTTIYSFSTLIIFTDRELVPTMPVVLWTIWFLYSVYLILKGKKYGYIIIGILSGLIWSINLQLVILFPIVLLATILARKKLNLKEIIIGVAIAVLLNIPFAAFEIRHGFQQTNALVSSLTTNKDYVSGTSHGFFPKLDRTMQLVYKNSTNLFWGNSFLNVPFQITFWTLILATIILIRKNKIDKNLGIISLIWIAIYVFFFTKISLNLSEYYLNGMNIIWILIIALGIDSLLQNKKYKRFGFVLMGLFLILNLYSFITRPVNANGYIQKREILSAIKKDAQMHGFPCVSLSFITSPGNNLGYRYFTWELGIKTKPISNNVPVYSIVFPLRLVDGFDKSFGSLGLILPDYKRYNEKQVKVSCEGEDYTLIEPMFGFTK